MLAKLFIFTAPILLCGPLAMAEPCTGNTCSFEITLVGQQTSPRAEDSLAVRTAIGTSVTDLAVRRYHLRATDIYGGWAACLEPANERGYDLVLDRLSRIRVDTRVTKFEVNLVRRCRP